LIVYEDILSEDQLDHVFFERDQILNEGVFTINKLVWPKDMWSGYTGSVYLKEAGPKITKIVLNILNMNIRMTTEDRRTIKVAHNFWDCNAGINWHEDQHVQWAATLYLTPDYEKPWGGFLCTRNEVYYPKFNTLVINDNKEEHKVTPILKKDLPWRHTLQIFGPIS